MSNVKLRSAPDFRNTESDNSVPPAEVAKRLVVELSRRTAGDLAWLVEEEETNKTNVVNKAVQLYRLILEAQRSGASVTLEVPGKERERLVML